MILWSLAGAVVLALAARWLLLRKGLLTPRRLRKLSTWERATAAWKLTDTDEIKPLKVCGATGADSGRRDRQHEADPGMNNQDRSASAASPIPAVQREIELRALLDAAMATGWAHPEQCPIWIHPHQADEHGQEIRN